MAINGASKVRPPITVSETFTFTPAGKCMFIFERAKKLMSWELIALFSSPGRGNDMWKEVTYCACFECWILRAFQVVKQEVTNESRARASLTQHKLSCKYVLGRVVKSSTYCKSLLCRTGMLCQSVQSWHVMLWDHVIFITQIRVRNTIFTRLTNFSSVARIRQLDIYGMSFITLCCCFLLFYRVTFTRCYPWRVHHCNFYIRKRCSPGCMWGYLSNSTGSVQISPLSLSQAALRCMYIFAPTHPFGLGHGENGSLLRGKR